MARAKKENDSVMRYPPATSPKAREDQLIVLATDLAEKQLREGKASSQVITHYLKLATTREQLEKQKLEKTIKLLENKSESYESAKRVEELYKEALDAMRTYSGQSFEDDEEDVY